MQTAIMTTTGRRFEVEIRGNTLLVTPLGGFSGYDAHSITTGVRQVLTLFDRAQARNAIVDLCRMDYGCSATLTLFAELSQRVRRSDGQLVFCNVSEHEHELLEMIHLVECCTKCESPYEALALMASRER